MEAGVLGNALEGVSDSKDESSSNIESPEKMTEDEQLDVEENFETHEEMINELVISHIKLDCDEEMLEMAKNIYSRMEGTPTSPNSQNENIKKLCDNLLALGEVNIENDNYSQAVEEITSCLEKRKDKLPKDTREIVPAWSGSLLSWTFS